MHMMLFKLVFILFIFLINLALYLYLLRRQKGQRPWVDKRLLCSCFALAIVLCFLQPVLFTQTIKQVLPLSFVVLLAIMTSTFFISRMQMDYSTSRRYESRMKAIVMFITREAFLLMTTMAQAAFLLEQLPAVA